MYILNKLEMLAYKWYTKVYTIYVAIRKLRFNL